MHEIQEKLLKLAGEMNLFNLSLLEIGRRIGVLSAQKIKHHLQQLEKRGLIRIDAGTGHIEKTKAGSVQSELKNAQLLAIPILGSANAGPALMNAEENIEGYLRVSSTIVGRTRTKGLYALRVKGPSMNKAMLEGKKIEDGDYVIVDSNNRSPKNGDIVLSVIDRMANIKRFHFDERHNQIVLVSDSTQDFPPIYIDPSDDYLVNGKVIQVIKKAK